MSTTLTVPDEEAIFVSLPNAKKDKTWSGLSIRMEADDTTFAEPLASVKMTFKLAGVSALTLTSEGGDITINDAASWDFTVEPIERLTLNAGVYSWAIETTSDADPSSVVDYWIGTLTVKEDSTP